MRVFSTLFFLLPFFAIGQNLDYVQQQVEALTDSAMHGRGYVMDGSNKASKYIANEFEEIGLKPVGISYYQPFKMDINTFPFEVSVYCDGQELAPGKDFILDPASGSSQGTYKVMRLDSSNFQETAEPIKFKKKMVAVDLTGIDSPDEVAALHEFKAIYTQRFPLVLLNPNKLTWSVGAQRYKNAIVEANKGAFCNDPNKVKIAIRNEPLVYEANNVVGKIAGMSSDSCFVITAHSDHLGQMGKALFAGASDNASGVATMLDLARHFAGQQPNYDIYFIAFAGEEAGLVGSKYFVDHPTFELERVKLLVNLDLMGSAAEGITVVNGRLYPEKMEKLAAINTKGTLLPKIKLRGKAANSDHYWFSERGVPSIFIYTDGNAKAYHDVNDIPSGLDWANYNDVFTLLVGFLDSL